MKKFAKEFREFIARGNVVDMAVGIIIGAAFTAIVNSVVSDLITPIIGIFTSGIAFEELVIPLAGQETGIRIGSFINAVLQFLIIAFVVFWLVKGVNQVQKLGKKNEEEKPAKKPILCPYCKQELVEGATRCPHCTSELPEPAHAAE